MKAILRGEPTDYETYRFIRECGVKAIVLLKFDLTVGPYIAFKGIYEQNVPIVEALDNPEYLAQFYVGIAGTEMDVLEKNEDRTIIARQTYTMNSTNNTEVLLLCIDNEVSTPAAINFADMLLKNSNAEPHLLEEVITVLKETTPNLKLQLKSPFIRGPVESHTLKKMPKTRTVAQFMRCATPFAFLQNREVNEIELRFLTLRKGMFFIRTHLERLDIARFFHTFLSNIVIEKNTTFSIDLVKNYANFDLGLTLLLPPNQRNFVERLAGALTMAGFSISLVREADLEDRWIAPLGITRGTTLRISRKLKDAIQVLSSPLRFISLFRSKTLQPLTIATLIQALESNHATILCKGKGKNKIEMGIILTKLHDTNAELDQFVLPNELAEHFKRVRGRRNIARDVKALLLRNCTKGITLSLQQLKEFFAFN